jgi:cytochrome c oxidase assembly protein subunit 15
MLVALVGAMTLLLAVVVWRTDPRRWMRGIVVAAVGLLILQGLLGGLRVVADERLLARVHGCTAPLFFTLCAILVSATSTRWLSGNAAVEQPAARRMHRLLWAIAAGLYLEIVLGTLLRVPSFAIDRHWFGLLIWAKIVGAGLIAAALAWLWIASRRKVFGQPMIALRARLLAGLFLLQVVLACATWVTHYGWPAWFSGTFGTVRYTVVETGWWQVLLTTLHVGVGALLLALATTLALWSHRLWREVPS